METSLASSLGNLRRCVMSDLIQSLQKVPFPYVPATASKELKQYNEDLRRYMITIISHFTSEKISGEVD